MKNIRKCGILLHPTSLPSNHGIGDLGKGAYNFINFLKNANQKLWQVLPLGPTSFGDSPYQSFSSFAGNFYLISLEQLSLEGLLDKSQLENPPDFSPHKIDYGKTIDYKISLFKKAFLNFKPNKDFEVFCLENSFWLDDYSLFSAVKDFYIEKRKYEFESTDLKNFCSQTKEILTKKQQKDFYYGGVWFTWDKALMKREESAIINIKKQLSSQIKYYKFLQFHFFKQWKALKTYANNNGIEIIGDIPIFVALDSADVWSNQNLFNLDKKGFPIDVAGVPPDFFSSDGQLWGNPLYNWQEHKKDNFSWWLLRIKNLLKITDIIRIDHFRGFESYYSIPFGSKDAKQGKWIKANGKELFEAMKKEINPLPIIAEDLGIITPAVTQLRDNFNLPGMKILQFAFGESENNPYLPHNCEKNCVVYTGTHDNDTVIGWYEKAPEKEKDYFRRYINSSGENPHWDLIRLAVSSTANYAVYPLQDVLGLGTISRMNIPGSAKNNWQWRYTEDMLLNEYAKTLKTLTEIFKR